MVMLVDIPSRRLASHGMYQTIHEGAVSEPVRVPVLVTQFNTEARHEHQSCIARPRLGTVLYEKLGARLGHIGGHILMARRTHT